MKLARGVTFSNISSLPESEINSERLEDLVTEATLEEGFGKDDLHSTLQSSLNFENGHEWADLDPALQALLPRILDEEHLSDELLATLAIQFDDPGYSRNITQDNIKMPGNPPLAPAMGVGVKYANKVISRNRDWIPVENGTIYNGRPYYDHPEYVELLYRNSYGSSGGGLVGGFLNQYIVELKIDFSHLSIPTNAKRLRFSYYHGKPISDIGFSAGFIGGVWAEQTNGTAYSVNQRPLDDILVYTQNGSAFGNVQKGDNIKITLTHYQA